MILAIVLAVILAVMRLSPNPVFRSVSWVYLWIFRGTPVYVQLVFWGLFPTIYKNIQLGIPFGPTFFTLNIQDLSLYFLLAVVGLGLNEAAYLAEIIRAGISSVPEGQSEASTALGHVVADDHAAHRVTAGDAGDHPADRQRVHRQLKTTSLVAAVPYTFDLFGRQRDISAVLFQPIPLLLVAAGWYLLITSILMVGQFYLERYFSRGVSRKLTTKQLEALAEAQTRERWGTRERRSRRCPPMVKAEGVCKNFGALKVLKGVTLEIGRGQVLVLVGPSGSGKSTFLRCINHLEQVNGGRLYVDGELIGYRERGGKLHEMPAAGGGQAAPRHRDGVPALQSVPASHRAGEHHRGAHAGEGRQEGGRRSSGPRICSIRSGCRTRRGAIRRSCPAGSSSGSRSRARWR